VGPLGDFIFRIEKNTKFASRLLYGQAFPMSEEAQGSDFVLPVSSEQTSLAKRLWR